MKYMKAKTVLRSYHHITKAVVDEDALRNSRREVKTYAGMVYIF